MSSLLATTLLRGLLLAGLDRAGSIVAVSGAVITISIIPVVPVIIVVITIIAVLGTIVTTAASSAMRSSREKRTLRPSGRYPARTLATGDHFNDGTADFPLLRRLGVGLRDMEGAAVAQIAESSSIPVRALKCVTNVIGAGATGQYEDNLRRCLDILSDALETWA